MPKRAAQWTNLDRGKRRYAPRQNEPKPAPHFAHGHKAAHPLEVTRAYVDALVARDLDAAMQWCAPELSVHTDAGDLTDRRHIRAWLENGPMFGAEGRARLHGDVDTVVVTWRGHGAVAPLQLRTRVEGGYIVEQWTPDAMHTDFTTATVAGAGVSVHVVTRGQVSDGDVAYALGRLDTTLESVAEPILSARLKLHRAADPARERPAMAEAMLDVNGDVVRAHVSADEMREAADRVQARLRDQLDHRREHREARAAGLDAAPSEWRHADHAARRPAYFDRPAEERRLVRHKTVALEPMTADEASFDMELMDLDFYLFNDLATGQDALVHHASAEPSPLSHAPRLSVSDAVQRLDTSAEPFVFFASPDRDRGAVVYRRYDGHYGLITSP